MKTIALFLLMSLAAAANAQTATELLAKAQAYEAKEDYKKALATVNEAIAKDPRNWKCYQKAGLYLNKTGNSQGSFDAYSKAILLNAEVYDLYMARGTLLESADLHDNAIDDFSHAIELAPDDSSKYRAYLLRGGSKNIKRDFPAAYADFMVVMAYDSSNLDLLNDLALVCLEYDKKQEGIRLLRRMLSLKADYPLGYANLGYALQQVEEYAASTDALDKAIALEPKGAYPYSNRSYNKMKLGDLPGAMKDVNQSIKLDPTNSYAYRNRGLIYLAMGDKEKACAEFKKALDLGFTVRYGNEVDELWRKNCR